MTTDGEGREDDLKECPFCNSKNIRWGNEAGDYPPINVCYCKRCQIEFVFCWHGNEKSYARAFNEREEPAS